MSKLPDLTLTASGAALLAKTPLGSPVPLTGWQIGTGTLPDGQQPRDRTTLVSPLHSLPIAKVENSENRCLVTGQFENRGKEAFLWRETGLFATDPDVGEILYAYGNAGDEAIPVPAGEYQFREYLFAANLVFDAAANVTAVIDKTMVFATLKELENYVPKTEKGAALGVASLDQDGKVPLSQLPAGVLSAPQIQVSYNQNQGGDA